MKYTPSRWSVIPTFIAIFLFLTSGFALTTFSDSIFPILSGELSSSSLFSKGAPAPVLEATINTDKDDYSPGQIVQISGTGWQPGEMVRLEVDYKPAQGIAGLGETEIPHGHDPWFVQADSSGNVASQWLVEEDSRGQTLLLTADGLASGLHAEKIFYDAASISLEQCHNWVSQTSMLVNCDDPFNGGQTNWGSGAAGSNNARLSEGDNQNFRAIMEGVEIGSYFITLELDLTKGGSVAYDRFSSPGRIRTAVDNNGNTKADGTLVEPEHVGVFPCANNNNPSAYCTPEMGTPYQIPPIPVGVIVPSAGDGLFDDDVLASQAADIPEHMFLYGGGTLGAPNTWVYTFTGTNTLTGDTSLQIRIPINKTGGTGTLVLAWGGHVSEAGDYVDSNHGTATTIEGSPYHMRLKEFTALNGSPGNQDMQMAASAIVQTGSITIIKDAVPNDAEDFSFSTTGGLTPATFDLDDDGDNGNTLSNTQVFSGVPSGMYTVTEGAETGFDLTNLLCAGGTSTSTDVGMRKATINLGAGENVTCTFTNTKRGAIKIVKNTVGGNGTFTFNPTGFNGGSSFDLTTVMNTAMQTFENIAPGSGYSISETVPTGWDLTSFTCDNGTIGAITVVVGQTTTCTAVNTKRGSIKVIKDALPDSDQDFTFDPSGLNGDVDFILDDDADGTNPNMIMFSNLVPGGSYSVVETATPLWQLAGITCESTGGMNNNTISVANRSVVFNLEAGEAITCTFRNINIVGFVTSSSLCTFDVDPVKEGDQFRLLYTPDNSNSVYKLNASNPGQYYYNVLHYSDPEDPNDNEVTMNIPFPFVTHGATPIHVYSSVTATQVDGQTCLEPGTEYSNSQEQITFEDYGNMPVLGVTTTSVTVDVPDGFSYVNIHLDYGLKRTTGYVRQVVGNMNNADQTLDPGPFRPDIPDCQPYTFSNGGTHVVESINSFKKNPGIGGLMFGTGEAPLPNQTLELIGPTGSPAGRVSESDEDGWYFLSYKHTGKEKLYTVRWLETGQTKQVLLRANGMAQIDFP